MEVEVVVENGDDSSEPVLTVEEVEDVELEGGHGQVLARSQTGKGRDTGLDVWNTGCVGTSSGHQ